MCRLFLCAVVLTTAITATGSARAGLVVFTDEAAFEAATTNLTTVNFNGLAPVDSFSYFGDSLTVGPVTFSDEGFTLFVIDPGFNNPSYAYSSGNQLLFDNFGGGAGLTVNLPDNINAVGVLVGEFGFDTGTITLDTGESFDFRFTGLPNLNFIGFATTDPILFFSIQDQFIQSPALDTLRFGQTVPLPEPATWLAACLGSLVGCAFLRRIRL